MKNWYKSKAIIIGILEVVSGTVAAVSGMLEEGATITVAGVIQIVIRLVTKEAIGKAR